METKSAGLTMLVDPVREKAFDDLSALQGLVPSCATRSRRLNYSPNPVRISGCLNSV